jgi:hypothetical protein
LQNKSKKELNKISYITIDENGVAKPLKDFTEEWEKKNHKLTNKSIKNEENELKNIENNSDSMEVLDRNSNNIKSKMNQDFELIKKNEELLKKLQILVKKLEENILLQTNGKRTDQKFFKKFIFR